MTNTTEEKFSNRLELLSAHPVRTQLAQINRGIEKEGLRVTAEGQVAGYLKHSLCRQSANGGFR